MMQLHRSEGRDNAHAAWDVGRVPPHCQYCRHAWVPASALRHCDHSRGTRECPVRAWEVSHAALSPPFHSRSDLSRVLPRCSRRARARRSPRGQRLRQRGARGNRARYLGRVRPVSDRVPLPRGRARWLHTPVAVQVQSPRPVAREFNCRRHSLGRLCQSRYRARVIDSHVFFEKAVASVHLNPVAARSDSRPTAAERGRHDALTETGPRQAALVTRGAGRRRDREPGASPPGGGRDGLPPSVGARILRKGRPTINRRPQAGLGLQGQDDAFCKRLDRLDRAPPRPADNAPMPEEHSGCAKVSGSRYPAGGTRPGARARQRRRAFGGRP